MLPGNACAQKLFTCYSCGEEITGKYVRVGDMEYHKACFTCRECGKQISGKFSVEGRFLYHPKCYKEAKGLVCDLCNKPLDDQYIEADDRKYHKSCFEKEIQLRCDICKRPITGSYKTDDDGSYHPACYNEHKLEKCVVCSLPIEGHFVSDLWGNNSHSEHEGKEPDMCSSCGRIISKKSSEGGFVLGDGRLTCGICSKSAVMTARQVKSLAQTVRRILAQKRLRVPKKIPIQLVNKNQLSEIADEMHSEGTKGFTSSKSKMLGKKVISSSHKIYILHSLPKIEFMGVLAHEFLHVWLNERRIELSPAETEGFCNLGVLLINSSSSAELAEKLTLNMEKNPDPVYGDGYREMKKQLDKLGWKGLLQKISG